MRAPILIAILALLASPVQAFESFEVLEIPTSPNLLITPGSLCEKPLAIRYPERIKYCGREVSSARKWAILENYGRIYGFTVDRSNRSQFKIDHLIPLCMGGSNEDSNLWPQHSSVYGLTDPMEPLLCGKMSDGRLTQRKAVEMIMRGKMDFSQIREVIAEAENL